MRSQRRLCFLDAISRFLLFGDDADQVCWAKKSKKLRKSDSDQRVTPAATHIWITPYSRKALRGPACSSHAGLRMSEDQALAA